MKLAATVLYVDAVQPVLDFYDRAFGVATQFLDLDVQLPGREPSATYEFAILDIPGSDLHIATHALGSLLMPGYVRPPDGKPVGVEIVFLVENVKSAFDRAVRAGAAVVAEPTAMPWGQAVAYVGSLEGTFVGLCEAVPD